MKTRRKSNNIFQVHSELQAALLPFFRHDTTNETVMKALLKKLIRAVEAGSYDGVLPRHRELNPKIEAYLAKISEVKQRLEPLEVNDQNIVLKCFSLVISTKKTEHLDHLLILYDRAPKSTYYLLRMAERIRDRVLVGKGDLDERLYKALLREDLDDKSLSWKIVSQISSLVENSKKIFQKRTSPL